MDNKNSNDPNRLITVAIHTFDRAVDLKNTLEEEGIEVKLHNVNLDEKVLASGVRVRIRERDLPLALQIIESPETITSDKRCVLLPVDFTAEAGDYLMGPNRNHRMDTGEKADGRD